MSKAIKHKVFISYHHENDQLDKEKFIDLFSDRFEILVNKSVDDGDINPNNKTETISQIIREKYVSDSTVTIVLIGKETWKRKYVDWEIAMSLRNTKNNNRSGLLGIILPDHPNYGKEKYEKYSIPPRLADNLSIKFASIYDWNDDPTIVSKWIDKAFKTRDEILPDNSRDLFAKNRPSSQSSWE